MKIFVDANVWLNFFPSGGLEELKAAADESILPLIFVTKQIVDEVQRNKLRIAVDVLIDRDKKYNHGAPPVGDDDEEWREFAQAAAKNHKQAKLRFDTAAKDLVEKISTSTDAVSIALIPFFERAQTPTEDQIARSRLRRELGNPPGKASDPLGDQLSWEQLIDVYDGLERLVIVTRDGDFSTKFGREFYLNPVLQAELAELADGTPDVIVVETLADALKLVPHEERPPELTESALEGMREQETEAAREAAASDSLGFADYIAALDQIRQFARPNESLLHAAWRVRGYEPDVRSLSDYFGFAKDVLAQEAELVSANRASQAFARSAMPDISASIGEELQKAADQVETATSALRESVNVDLDQQDVISHVDLNPDRLRGALDGATSAHAILQQIEPGPLLDKALLSAAVESTRAMEDAIGQIAPIKLKDTAAWIEANGDRIRTAIESATAASTAIARLLQEHPKNQKVTKEE